jgi:outer membrane receptor protein involved in Fe transport
MNNLRRCLPGFCLAAAFLHAEPPPASVNLPGLIVYSTRVANQSPSGTFAMPVSPLRFEPLVDLQARNLAEAQADVTLRGGVFENTGFRLGAISLVDPQTGHYLAEIPVAPNMLGSPVILTGTEHALAAMNSTVGGLAYGWRPVRPEGILAVGLGEAGLNRQEFYEGYVSSMELGGRRLAADAAWARSESNGAVPFGDSKFSRINARLQLAGQNTQTDLVAGYQKKFFGWPNLYTPFNSNETENLETLLFAINHRSDLGHGDFFELGAFHRRNKDDYAFNRFAPLGPVHPFQHTTLVDGAALGARREFGPVTLNFHAETSADDLQSTSLTFGNYHARTMTRLVLVPEKTWRMVDGTSLVAKAGAGWDASNHGGSAGSPIFELAREQDAGSLRRLYLSLATTTQLPSYTALNSNPAAGLFRGNPNLRRETSRNLELGVQGLFDGWTGQAAVFHRLDDSLVDWTFRRGVTARTANPVDIVTTGTELVARRSWSAVDLVVGYTWLTKDANYRGALVDASFYALNYARHRVTAALTMRLGHGFELRLDHVARWQADNLLRTAGGTHALTGALGLAWRPASLRTIEFDVRVDNLWNSAYQEIPAVPASPRQLSAGVSCTW